MNGEKKLACRLRAGASRDIERRDVPNDWKGFRSSLVEKNGVGDGRVKEVNCSALNI